MKSIWGTKNVTRFGELVCRLTKQTTAQFPSKLIPLSQFQIHKSDTKMRVWCFFNCLRIGVWAGDSGMRDARDSGKTGTTSREGCLLGWSSLTYTSVSAWSHHLIQYSALSLPNIFFSPINRIRGRPALGRETLPERKIDWTHGNPLNAQNGSLNRQQRKLQA